jgi:hypothetical protein
MRIAKFLILSPFNATYPDAYGLALVDTYSQNSADWRTRCTTLICWRSSETKAIPLYNNKLGSSLITQRN